MRKFRFFMLFMMIVGISLSIIHIGCKTDEEPTGPSDKAQDYSPQKQYYSRIELTSQSADPTSSGLERVIITACLWHNYNRGAPASEITVVFIADGGSFSETEELVLTTNATTTGYVQNGEDCVSVDLFYPPNTAGYVTIQAQTNYGDGANPISVMFGEVTTTEPTSTPVPTATPTPEPYTITLTINPSAIGGDAIQTAIMTATIHNNTRPVSNIRVTFETQNGGCPDPDFAYTDSNGVATTTLVSGLAIYNDRIAYGIASFLDTEENITYSSAPFKVTFLAPGYSFKIAAGSTTVNVGASTDIQVKLLSYGSNPDPVANANIQFTIQSGAGSFSSGSVVQSVTVPTDANGDAWVQLTSSAAGVVTVQIAYTATDCDGISTETLLETRNFTFE